MSDIGMRRTFGVLDRTDLDDLHVVSIKGGDPLIDLPESEVTAWAAGTFALGDQRSYAPTHGVYTCIKAHTTSGGKTPANDPENWHFFSVTSRWRAFDAYRNTKTIANDKLRIVLRPRVLIDTLDLQGVRATQISITVTDGPGGPTVFPETVYSLDGVGVDDWEPFFYGTVTVADSLFVTDIELCADPVITIDLDYAGNQVELGLVQLGRYVELGWTEYGADIGVLSYSYYKEAEDGTYVLKKRPGAGDMNVSVFVEPADANKVAAIMDKFDGVPTLWIGHTDLQHAPLRKTGFFEGRLTYNNWWQRTLSGRIKGIV